MVRDGVAARRRRRNRRLNALAKECFNRTTRCPSHQLAIETGGLVLSAPIVNAPVFAGSVQISGGFGEPAARALAGKINDGAAGFTLQLREVLRYT